MLFRVVSKTRAHSMTYDIKGEHHWQVNGEKIRHIKTEKRVKEKTLMPHLIGEQKLCVSVTSQVYTTLESHESSLLNKQYLTLL